MTSEQDLTSPKKWYEIGRHGVNATRPALQWHGPTISAYDNFQRRFLPTELPKSCPSPEIPDANPDSAPRAIT